MDRSRYPLPGLLEYTGDPDLPLEDYYPFIGMAGMGLGGLLTRAAMKTPVRSLIRKEPTLPKVTIKKKKNTAQRDKRKRRQTKKAEERMENRHQEYLDSGGQIDPVYELARLTGKTPLDYTKRVYTGFPAKGKDVEIPFEEYMGRLYTKGQQRQRVKQLRKQAQNDLMKKRMSNDEREILESIYGADEDLYYYAPMLRN